MSISVKDISGRIIPLTSPLKNSKDVSSELFNEPRLFSSQDTIDPVVTPDNSISSIISPAQPLILRLDATLDDF